MAVSIDRQTRCRALCLLGALLLSIHCVAMAQDDNAAALAKGVPSVRFDPPRLFVGRMPQNAFATAVIRVWNDGTGVLKIGRIESSCGCAVGIPSRKEVPSHEFATISVVFRSGSLSGYVDKVFLVHTNDPNHPSVEIPVAALVAAPVSLDTEEILFPSISQGETVAPRFFTVLAEEARDLKILHVDVSSPAVVVSRQRTARRGHVAYEFGVRLRSDKLRTGPLNADIRIETDNPDAKELHVRILGNVTGPIRITPRLFSFGLIHRGKGAHRKVRVEKVSSGTFTIRKITCSPKWIRTSVEPVTPGKLYEITVMVPPSSPPGRVVGELAIETSDPDMPIAKVSLYGIVR